MPSAFWATRLSVSRAIYDRHGYGDEMADALKRLARLIEKIVNGEPDNVVPFIAQ